MELQIPPSPTATTGLCSCPCCCSPIQRRSVKRKLDLIDPAADVARVEVETEAAALREALATQQESIRELSAELEEERNASATAANETMSMILRLQSEKAEALMEVRQFKRFAEERMAHDQRELYDLEDLLFRRDEAIQSLSSELQSYRHRLLSYGIEFEAPEAAYDSQFEDFPSYDYPPLRCSPGHGDSNVPDADDNYASMDLEKYAYGETPHAGEEDLQSLEQRIRHLETATPSSSHVSEKDVLPGQSPPQMVHLSTSSAGSYGSKSVEELKEDEFPVRADRASDDGGADDASDRVYTIDAVHGVPLAATGEDQHWDTAEGKEMVGRGGDVEEGDIKKLYSRLQALEADRESMKQAIISMRTEKAQLVLLREIAQQLCKEVKPERTVVKKPSLLSSFPSLALFKVIKVNFLA